MVTRSRPSTASTRSCRRSAASVSDAKTQDLLVTDAQDVTRQTRGIPDAPAPADLGVTSAAYPGQPRHPYVTPAMPVHNANAKFKILVIANKNDGSFRHPAIEDAEVTLQELGAAKGFDVDLWDPSWPAQSLNDTPFTSAANLAQYAVIVGDSSVGNNTFNAAYTMKDGTVVNEQAAFKGYINNGGGYVALHAANDSMHNWREPAVGGPLWYQAFLGGLFASHPANQNGFGTDCGSCYWAEVVTEDNSHPSTAPSVVAPKVAVADELYHFDRKPRPYVHVLQTLTESTYVGAMGVGANAGNTEGGDHPITWCSNFDGGREWSQVLGHNWELYRTTPWFRESIYQGILTAAGMKPANCVTHVEVKTLLSSLQASGGITADGRDGRYGRSRRSVHQVHDAHAGGLQLVADRHRGALRARRRPRQRRRRLAGEDPGQGPGTEGLDGGPAGRDVGRHLAGRHGPGHAGAHAGHARLVRRVHTGHRQVVHGGHHGHRDLDRG